MSRPHVPTYRLRNVHSSTNVTTTDWVQLDSALDAGASCLEIFDSSGSVLKLAIGASGAEVELPFYIMPGGNSQLIQVPLSAGQRLAVRAVDTNATTGQLLINLYY